MAFRMSIKINKCVNSAGGISGGASARFSEMHILYLLQRDAILHNNLHRTDGPAQVFIKVNQEYWGQCGHLSRECKHPRVDVVDQSDSRDVRFDAEPVVGAIDRQVFDADGTRVAGPTLIRDLEESNHPLGIADRLARRVLALVCGSLPSIVPGPVMSLVIPEPDSPSRGLTRA